MPLVIPYIQQHFLPGFNGFANRYTWIKQDITKLKTMECAGIASLWQDMKTVSIALVDLVEVLSCAAQKADIFEKQRRRLALS